ncbi:putative T7SS-secreted protein [Gordonia alkanivorans]|uniref:putative T7SS-secreted protein n=1 Tax=Gordonia alkanivorans TaxID=84096 RepID=UPI002448672A|nr:RHS repeat-associated core domain-containing protein [Gordonia alkanivorans]MDH3022566.1 RHS repeat-associated core domain-containing protein [Gordonia alkanivorans]MDJ0007439.1 RHS repeat-associated core domain-containing protein [Gordonia alkanivorans]MDJ0099677.1 RHS repeat-associated core domain-containing protein [Gordonia alkanivorans]MDJ0492811.1 RHS repeat-associated core domain-containing protein [Gordonia alkanivorans]
MFDFLEDGKEFLGEVVDGATDLLGSGLRTVGLDKIAATVEDFGDDVANSLGAMPDELELERTNNPKELVLGDPAGIRELAGKFTDFAGNFTSAGEGLRGISAGDWTGDGAQGFGDAIGSQVPKWFAAAEAASKAAAALTSWAGVVEFAQQKAAEAVRVWEEGKRKQAEWDEKRRQYNSELDDYQNNRRDTPPVHPGPDPWPGYREEARRILKIGRDHRNSAAPGTKAELSGAANLAPPMPSAFEQAQMSAKDIGTAGFTAFNHFEAGMIGSVTEVVKALNMLNPTNICNVTNPHQYARNTAGLVAGLVHQVAHPDEFVRGFIGSGWSGDPSQALGNLTGNILMTVAPGPKGTAALTAGLKTTRHLPTPDSPTPSSPTPRIDPVSRETGPSPIAPQPSTPDITPASHSATPSSDLLGSDGPDLPITHDGPPVPQVDGSTTSAQPDVPSPSSVPDQGTPAGGAVDSSPTPTPDAPPARPDAPPTSPDQPVGGAFDGSPPVGTHTDRPAPTSTPEQTTPRGDGPDPTSSDPVDGTPNSRPLGDDDPPGPDRGETTTPTGLGAADTSSPSTTPHAPIDQNDAPSVDRHDSPSNNPDGDAAQPNPVRTDDTGATDRDGAPVTGTPEPTPSKSDGDGPGHGPARTDEPTGQHPPKAADDRPGTAAPRTDSDAPGSARPTPVAPHADAPATGPHPGVDTPSRSPSNDSPTTPVAPVTGPHTGPTPHSTPDAGQSKPANAPVNPATPNRPDAPAAPPRTPDSTPDRTPPARATPEAVPPRDGARPAPSNLHHAPEPAVRHTPDRDPGTPATTRITPDDRPIPAALFPDRPAAPDRSPTANPRPTTPDPDSSPRHPGQPNGPHSDTPDIDHDTREPHDPANPGRTDDHAPDRADTSKGNEAPTQCRSNGEPVNVASGEYFLPLTDVELPGVLPVHLTHRHRSRYRWGRWMGPTTPSTFDARAIVGDDLVTIVDADGTMTNFPKPEGDSVSRSVNATDWELRTTPTGGYQVTHIRDRLSWFFVPIPELGGIDVRAGSIAVSAMTDRHQNRIEFIFDERGRPTAVEHSAGYRIDVQCDGARLLGYRLTAGLDGLPVDQQLCTFDYHQGNLAASTNAEGATTYFGYDDAARMTWWRDSLGMEYWNAYDDLGRVTIQSGMNGVWSGRFEYHLRPDGDGSYTTYRDAVGATTVYGVDPDGRVRQESDPAGRITATDYNANRQPLSITSPGGARTMLHYNAFGDVEQVTAPDGKVTDVVYAGPGRPERIVEPGGITTRIGYDEDGSPTSVVDNAGAETSYTYDEHGALKSHTDPDGVVVRYRNNAAGLPVTISDTLGNTTRISYDGLGRPTEVVDAEGAQTVVTYDAMGNRTSVTAPDGGQSRWEYDGEGNCIAYTDPVGAVTRWEYGHYDLPVARIDADGSRTEFSYDATRRLVAVTNPDDLVWTYTYNADGTLASETDFNNATTSYTYDDEGRLASRTNAAGQTVFFTYDAAGRLIGDLTADPVNADLDGETTEYSFDAAGRLDAATGVFGRWHTSYTAAGLPQLTGVHDGRSDWIIESAWTGAGRLASLTSPTGVSTRYGYDPRGVLGFLSTAGRSCDITTSPTGREQRRRFEGAAIDSTWDPVGRLTGRSVIAVAERPAALNLGLGAAGVGERRPDRTVAAAEYSYRSDGILTASTSTLAAGRTDYRVDVLGRVVEAASPAGTEQFSYAATGNITDYVSTGVSSSSPEVRGATDPLLPEVRGASRASKGTKGRRRYSGTLLVDDGRTSYRYDAAGRVISMSRRRLSRKPDVWHYAWDAHDHLRSVTTSDGTVWTYTYDHVGRRLSKTDQSTGETTRFHWHGEHLVEQTDPMPDDDQWLQATTWAYSPAAYAPLAQTTTSEPIGLTDVDSSEGADQDREFSLNLGNDTAAVPPSARRWTQSEIDREFFAIVTDQIASPTALVDPGSGEIAGRSVRTLYGETAWTGVSTPWSYPGQYLDLETGLHYNRHRYYHPDTGRYLSPDPLGLAPAPNPHTYPTNPAITCDPFGLMPCSGDEIVDTYGPLNPGPLLEQTRDSFRGAIYTEKVTTEPMTLYRVGTAGEGPFGKFWTRVEPLGPIQARIDSALNPLWGNKATAVTTIEVPAGVRYFEGFVAPQDVYAGGVLLGGGNQIVFRPDMRIPSEWLRVSARPF